MTIYNYLKENIGYTDYQIQILRYFFCTICSEISKFILLSIYFLFSNMVREYLFSVILLIFLRFFSGGLHRKTYMGCLLYSFSYLVLSIQLLPQLNISIHNMIFNLLLCCVIIYKVGPIPSIYRKHNPHKLLLLYRYCCTFLVLLYTLCIIIIPRNQYTDIGFWVIIIHTLQLLLSLKEVRIKNEK